MRKSFNKWLLGLVAAGFPLLAAGVASADTVSYETYGVFGSLSGDTVSNSTSYSASSTGPVSTISNSDLSLKFTGVGAVTLGTSTPAGASFNLGTFKLSMLAASGPAFGTDTFTINLEQLSPTAGSISSVATLSGSITSSGSQALVISFNPGTFTIGNERYVLPSLVGVNAGTKSVLSAAVFQTAATPSSTPLPKSSMAGVGLLAVFGMSKLKLGRSKAQTT